MSHSTPAVPQSSTLSARGGDAHGESPRSFAVRTRDYHTSRGDKTGATLKFHWELAPRGKVFYFGSTQPVAVPAIGASPTAAAAAAAGEAPPPAAGQLLTVNQVTPPTSSNESGGGGAGDDEDADAFYVPGIQVHALDQLRATAIAGNDISSSCLYATGIVAQAAGIYAPFSSALVCVVLFWFRKIYSEVFSALPMNGGTYNALLNTSNKNMAALAAILSTLSYTATAVTSAASAGDYLHYQWDAVPSEWVCIGILCFFAALTLMGIQDSANAATGLFILHITTMAMLVCGSLIYVIRDGGEILKNSWNSSAPAANPNGSIPRNLYFGFCSALLGVTGFESSSNYIEEQRPGVFPKTLRNMWITITLINPPLAVLGMGVLPIESLVAQSDYSLAAVANTAIGHWFKLLVVIDAALVLSGAVLTSYVGITGLHRRLALDRIMPNFFLVVNPWRGTNHVIILTFCALTVSLRLLVSDMSTLGGVYAIAFLGVMALFCLSNFLLKFKRGHLPRTPIAHSSMVFLATGFVIAGIVGNFVKSPDNAQYFSLYFVIFAIAVLATKLRVPVMRLLLRAVPKSRRDLSIKMEGYVRDLRRFPVVFFAKTATLHTLNKAVQYIIENEDTSVVKIVYMMNDANRASIFGDPRRTNERGYAAAPAGSAEDDAAQYSDEDDTRPLQSPEGETAPVTHLARSFVTVVDANGKPKTAPVSSGAESPKAASGGDGGGPRRTRDFGPLAGSDDDDDATLSDARATFGPLPPKASAFLLRMEESCAILDELYPKMTIELYFVRSKFSPGAIFRLSEQLGIPRNYMFMGCPSNKFPHSLGSFGGVRLITH